MNNSNEIIERVITLDDYQPHPRNYNKHPNAQIERLVHSLDKFGQVRNIVVWRQWFIAGHGVAQAAVESGRTTLRANVIPDDWPEERVLAYLAADNELGKLSQPDDAQLLAILDEVKQFDHELLLASGFDQERFDDLIRSVEAGLEPENAGKDVEPEIDKAEELRRKWDVQPGQMWQLGEHRIICGDCTDRATVERLMGGEKASIIFTDPPYGVAIGAKNRMLNSFQKAGRNLTDIEDDDMNPDELKERLLPAFNLIRVVVMADDCTIFMTSPQGGDLCMMMMMMMIEAKLPTRHILIWVKNAPTFSMGRLDYDYQHEPILMTWGKRHKRPMNGHHKTSVWEIDKPRASAEHPTMKPVELYENAYLNNSDAGDVAYEPYLGSGTAIIACENLGRKCRAVEIHPPYVAVALERWHQLTSEIPTLVE